MDSRVLRSVHRWDRWARRIITVGGAAVIVCVIGILFLIVRVTFPLFQDPEAIVRGKIPPSANAADRDVLAVGLDEYGRSAYALTRSGECLVFDISGGKAPLRVPVGENGKPVALRAVESVDPGVFTLAPESGSIRVIRIVFSAPPLENGTPATVKPPLVKTVAVFPPPGGMKPQRALARVGESGGITLALQGDDGSLVVLRRIEEEDLLGGKTARDVQIKIPPETGGVAKSLALDLDGKFLYVGTSDGAIRRIALGDEAVTGKDTVTAFRERKGIAALAVAFGDVSLAVGAEDGAYGVWAPVRTTPESSERKLRETHNFEPMAGGAHSVMASPRAKTLLALDAEGRLRIDHLTSGNRLLSIGGDAKFVTAAWSPRGDAAVALDAAGGITAWTLRIPHPEASWKSLFLPVWYENYDAPQHVWQSSSARDDFEPKYGIVPLLFGTFKGTFYAMLFAIPLALFGAAYTSQFASPFFRQTVKPAVEIMAAVPSVVIGFLAALWLAPLTEAWIVSVFLSFVTIPVCFVTFMMAWQPLRKNPQIERMTRGYEFLLLAPVVAVGIAMAAALGPSVETWLFDGSFKLWLFHDVGIRYDQRNSLIIAFGLGFAVIPIIFSISEDALSTVPPNLSAASLALGASRWQTVWRVILPSASPGIFAAVMIGFGRAVGETMIVLMATGNTPILDMSPFNGMRTLSANIAVEIPEAPVDGTLYRLLFLCAVILFLLTFALNTAAELVRHRLRKKYGRF